MYSNFLLISLALFSCSNHDKSFDLLKQAQLLAEENPQEALTLLDSIQKPETMPKDEYMQYVVASVYSKYRSNIDITADSLIFVAQEYFSKQDNPEQAALANLCAGNVYHKTKKSQKALSSYIQGKEYAVKSSNNLLAGKLCNNIGYMYFEQNMMDSAIIQFGQALDWFNKKENADTYKLQIFNSIGIAHYAINILDSAYYYHKKGLELATKINDKSHQAKFAQQLGVTYRDMGDYKKASQYLHAALPHIDNTEDSLRMYLNLTKLYNIQHKTDSARYYTNLVKNRVHEITYLPTVRNMYATLAEYSKQIGNTKEEAHYIELMEKTDSKIIEYNWNKRVEKELEESMGYKVNRAK